MAKEETTPQKRVSNALKKFEAAREALDAFISENNEVFEEAEELSIAVNISAQKLAQACRETGLGAGPITTTKVVKPVYDTNYLLKLFKDDDDARNELLSTEIKVDSNVFKKYLAEGRITNAQAKKAVTEVKTSVRLDGVPKEINIT